MIYYDIENNREFGYSKTKFHQTRNRAPVYGEYFDFTGIVTFQESELNSTNAYTTFCIEGPGKFIIINQL